MVIFATSLPLRKTLLIGFLVVAMATLLAIFHLPLRGFRARLLSMPADLHCGACGMAIVSALTFTGIYAYASPKKARLLETALSATELVLQREQHLSAWTGWRPAARA